MKTVEVLFLPRSNRTLMAWRMAIGITAAISIAFALHLPQPYWAGITALMITKTFLGDTFQRCIFRFWGTFVGAVVGVLLAGFCHHSLWLFYLSCFLISTTALYFQQVTRYPYAFLIGGVTALLIITTLISSPENTLMHAIWRVLEITLGIICAFAVTIIINPKRTDVIIKNESITIFKQLSEIFPLIIKNYFEGAQPNHNTINTELAAVKLLIQKQKTRLQFCEKEIIDPMQLQQIQQFVNQQQSLYQLIVHLIHGYNSQYSYHWLHQHSKIFSDLTEQLTSAIYTIDTMLDFSTLTTSFSNYDEKFQQLRTSPEFTKQHVDENIALHEFFHTLEKIMSVLRQLRDPMMQTLCIDPPSPANSPIKINTDALLYAAKNSLAVIFAIAWALGAGWGIAVQGVIVSLVLSQQTNVLDNCLFGLRGILGCLIGATLVMFALNIFQFTFLSLIIVIFIICWIFGYFTVQSFQHFAGALQVNLAVLMGLAETDTSFTNITTLLLRIGGIALGATCVIIVNFMIFPVYPGNIINKQLGLAKEFLLQQLRHWQKNESENKTPEILRACSKAEAPLKSMLSIYSQDHSRVQQHQHAITVYQNLTIYLNNLHQLLLSPQLLHHGELLNVNIDDFLCQLIVAIENNNSSQLQQLLQLLKQTETSLPNKRSQLQQLSRIEASELIFLLRTFEHLLETLLTLQVGIDSEFWQTDELRV